MSYKFVNLQQNQLKRFITNFSTIHTWHKNLAKIIQENFFSIFTTSFGSGPKIKKQITNEKTNNYGKKVNSIEF